MVTANRSAFGQLVRQCREAVGLSQRALAQQVGLDVSYINRLESGERRPRRRTVLKLAASLGISGPELDSWLAACDLSPMPLLAGLSATRKAGETAASVAGAPSQLPSDPLTLWEALATIGLDDQGLLRLLKNLAAAPWRRQQAAAMVAATLELVTDYLAAPVTKAIIPAAGWQHRLLAAHIMQRLLLQSMAEAAAVGVHQFLLVLAPGTEEALYRPLQTALSMAAAPRYQVDFCLQPTPLGLGDAVWRAAAWVGQEVFLVLLPDEMVDHRSSRTMPRELQQMRQAVMDSQTVPLIAVETVPKSRLPLGGVVRLGGTANGVRLFHVEELLEKPPLTHPILTAEASRSIVGRYFLPPEIFAALEQVRQTGSRPLELTAALEYLRQQGTTIYAYELKRSRRDLGGVIERAGGLLGDL
ncbi:MAG: helix-turn-helix domain-containing protein [Desulfobacca sp.]|uniref:helix-turn-helix domain-containing protein n=1 Tax=Desulfobacca sp. TaxID=2067990 RepID=UPI00404A023E